jgi:transposase
VSLSQCCSSLSCVSGQVLRLLAPHLAGTAAEGGREDAGRVFVEVRAAAAGAACPRCGQLSARRHSGYRRRLRDAPAGGRDVVVCLAVRRFFCLNPACPQVTFAEQVQGLASRFSRRTPPLTGALSAVAAALAGRAGARLAAGLGIVPPSRQTMIGLVMALPEEEVAAAPQVLGVDDFALRRGHVYGTVLIDMETGDVVDLLPDREAATLKQWLDDHPGVQVICRDRAGAYADGARQGAPDAVQVADRWHLLHNLRQKTYEAAAAHRAACLAAPAEPQQQQEQQEQQEQEEQEEQEEQAAAAAGEPGLARRTRQRHADVRALLDAGHTRAAAARILGLSLPTVYKYANAATAEQITAAPRAGILDPWKPYLTGRWNDGIHDAAVLHAEIKARGYKGSDQQVRRFIRPFRALPPGTAAQAPPGVPSARQITAWLMTRPGSLTSDDTAALHAVTGACPHLRQLQAAIRSFCDMITGLAGDGNLDTWLAIAETSGIPQLASFAAGIRKDHAAVLNGLTLSHSSGKVEGTVNKIKMLKRQMYGRASFRLLRKRVLLA